MTTNEGVKLKRMILATGFLFVAAVPASAQAHLSHSETTAYGRAYAHVRIVFGSHAAGCKLIGPHSSCHGRVTDARIRRSTDVLHRMFAPKPVYHSVYHSHTYTTSTYNAPSSSTHYSSGGYCGAYQFDQSTWSSVGMPGSPCGASPSQQDQAAARLYSQRGSEPWPVCGRYAPNWAAVRQCENSGSYAP